MILQTKRIQAIFINLIVAEGMLSRFTRHLALTFRARWALSNNQPDEEGQLTRKRGSETCFHCHSADHFARDCPSKKSQRLCFNCGKPGHVSANCQ